MSIIYYPNKSLLSKTEEINFNEVSKQQLLDWKSLMIEEMIKLEGIGLAANQIGINKKMCVVYLPSSTNNESLFLINPKIIRAGKDSIIYKEGCLSFPSIQVDKKRNKIVTVQFENEDGEIIERVFKGIESVCVQHEIDHLNGITFIDDFNEQDKEAVIEKIEKFVQS